MSSINELDGPERRAEKEKAAAMAKPKLKVNTSTKPHNESLAKR